METIPLQLTMFDVDTLKRLVNNKLKRKLAMCRVQLVEDNSLEALVTRQNAGGTVMKDPHDESQEKLAIAAERRKVKREKLLASVRALTAEEREKLLLLLGGRSDEVDRV